MLHGAAVADKVIDGKLSIDDAQEKIRSTNLQILVRAEGPDDLAKPLGIGSATKLQKTDAPHSAPHDHGTIPRRYRVRPSPDGYLVLFHMAFCGCSGTRQTVLPTNDLVKRRSRTPRSNLTQSHDAD